MLVNLSNHPWLRWGTQQRGAALAQFGEVLDLPFPTIDPTATSREIAALVAQYVAQVNRIFEAAADQTPDAAVLETADGVHLMGETSFVVEFALQWHSGEIREPLYCSTTQREVAELPDGSKNSVFRFVQFRPMGGR